MSKKTIYVLTISETFPKTHIRSGQPTGFVNKIATLEKIHTIRGNYDLWQKRSEKINNGEAVLSIRVWTGKPYNSKQREVFVLEKIGIQKILFDDYLYTCKIDEKRFSFGSEMISEHDGLNDTDFENWFKGYDFSKPMAVIHFTEFRYN